MSTFPQMRRLGFVLFLVIASSTPAANDAADRAMATIRPEAIRADMRFLSDSLLEGRRTGTRGHEIAAKFMATQFEAMGLDPAGDKGTYFQSVPFRGSQVDASQTTMSWTVEQGRRRSYRGQAGFSGFLRSWARGCFGGERTWCIVGYGLQAPELHHMTITRASMRRAKSWR